MNIEDIKKVLILGAGTMGQQIGFQCAVCGYEVILYDIGTDMLEKATARIRKLAEVFVASGKITDQESRAAMDRITTSNNAEEAAKNVDLINESIPEDPELKGRVFAQFNELCPEHTIFTTNTSSLVPSQFAAQTGRPDRFAAFHFHDITFTNIVDIMPHPGTSEETIALIEAFARKIDQKAIVLTKEQNGYVFNTMLISLFEAAQTLAEKDVASVEDIDRAWMGVMHTMLGPFGIMDTIGLDTVWKVTDYWATQTGKSQKIANADFIKKYVDAGNLGLKTGKGFYSYPNPDYADPNFLK